MSLCRFVVACSLCAVLSGCYAENRTPTSPSGPTPTTPLPILTPTTPPPASTPPVPVPPPSPARGEIRIREIVPRAGATLRVVEACSVGAAVRRCVEGWRGIFDVTLDQDVHYALLFVGFYSGSTLCAYGVGDNDVVQAGRSASFELTRIYLSDEYGLKPCDLPVTTTRIQATLESQSVHTTVFEQELSGSYTFGRP